MERTPSPPRRVRTPPAPLYGGDDGYQPFSPRRSSRVAAQQYLQQEQISPARTRLTGAGTSPSKQLPATRTFRTSQNTLSPPSSPASPAKHRSPRFSRRLQQDNGALDFDSDITAPSPARRLLSNMAPQGSLLTPVKTPRKRALETQDSLGHTARVLFPGRPATIEDAMPNPRKIRKGKPAYTLESFTEQLEEEHGKIEIYTDSKDRIPTRDNEDENPFMSKKGKAKAKTSPRKSRRLDTTSKEMFDAAKRDEGMVYIFRGKKIFKKFHDNPPSNASDVDLQSEDELHANESDLNAQSPGDGLRRSIGLAGRRPLTRSAIKPRLLFQDDIKQLQQGNTNEDDEEAVTDIEVTVTTPSSKTPKRIGAASFPASTQEATPPSTMRIKRQISFDSWARVKPSTPRGGSGNRDSAKRSGSPLSTNTGKRTRGARSELSVSDMSIDS